MDADAPRDPFAHFQQLDAPRGPSRWHRFDDMLVIAILAVLCGASGWTEVQQFGQAKGSDFATVTRRELANAQRMVNNRRRKCLNYRTPREVLNALPGVALRN